MTKTATKTKKASAEPIVAGEGYKQLFAGEVSIANIQVQSNFRKTFEDKALRELSTNIAKVGVLQPIILRQTGEGFPKPAVDGEFVLVAGERRLRAASLAGLTKIPARVLDLTEEQALEVQALENLHRRDLNPIEEARAFKVLLDQKGHSVEQAQDLADRVGKSREYVYRALRLLELPDKVTENIEDGKWTPAHGHQLLRLDTEPALAAAIDWLERGGDNYSTTVPSALSLRSYIERGAKRLEDATFPTDQDYASCIPCNTCPSNTTNQSSLFDGSENGHCLNVKCYERKTAQMRKDTVTKALEEMPAGVKNMGTKMLSNGNIQGMKGVVTLAPKEITSEVREIMEANPKAFGMAILNSRYEYENRDRQPVIICTDPKILGAKVKVPVQEPRTDYAKENFIEEATDVALMKAVKDMAPKKVTAQQLVLILVGMQSECYDLCDKFSLLFGLKENARWEKHAATLKEPELLGTVLAAAAIMHGGGGDKEKAFKALGVDVKGITKTTKAAAAKEYDAKKAAEKAKGKTDDSNSDENSDGDEE